MILQIDPGINIGLQYIRNTSEYIPKLQLHQHFEVRNISNQDVSLVLVRDYVQNTLTLALATKNRVVEVKMNLDDIPILDMIHLHKKT